MEPVKRLCLTGLYSIVTTFQISYQQEFEKARGKYTAVIDDTEILRHLKNQETVSLVLPKVVLCNYA